MRIQAHGNLSGGSCAICPKVVRLAYFRQPIHFSIMTMYHWGELKSRFGDRSYRVVNCVCPDTIPNNWKTVSYGNLESAHLKGNCRDNTKRRRFQVSG